METDVKMEHINMGTIWTMIVGTALGIVYMFNTFATASEMKKQVDILQSSIGDVELVISYGQYYDRLDDYDEAVDEENMKLAKEYKRMLERLEAKICEADPEWERCDETLDHPHEEVL